MSDIRTSNIEANIKLTNSLTLYGLDMMRYSVLDLADAKALKIIKQNTKVPVIADIHFNAALAMECINSGVDKIRLNPGNMPIEKVKSIRDAMKAKGIALRIGVNSGSLGKYGRATLSNIDPFFFALDDMLEVFKDATARRRRATAPCSRREAMCRRSSALSTCFRERVMWSACAYCPSLIQMYN